MAKKEILCVVFLLVLILIVGCQKEESPKVKVSARLEKNPIKDGENTSLILEVKNIGAVEVHGKFEIRPEDTEFVQVKYSGEEEFKIISGESIIKNYQLTGTTRTIETGVKLTINLIDLNNDTVIYSNEDNVLYIRRE